MSPCSGGSRERALGALGALAPLILAKKNKVK